MTREEAIAMIEDDKKRHHDELSGRYRAALTMAIEALQQEPEWIPVSERLPDDGKWAIWCSKDGVIGIARFKEDDYDHFYPNGTSFRLEDAVAWMPLPEPYEGSDEQ